MAVGPLAGCGDTPGGSGADPDTMAGHAALNQLIDGIPELVLPPPLAKMVTPCADPMCPKDGQEGDEYCTYRHYEERVHHDRFVAFQPNSATLWPGVVVKGRDAQDGLLTPIGVKLAPVTFSVSLENLKKSPVGEMKEPSLSAFRDARNEILAGGVTGDTPASIDYEAIQLHSETQIATALGAGIRWPGGAGLTGSFNFASTEKRTKILVNFTQAYYTIDVDSKTAPKDFFDTTVTADDLRPYVDNGNPPLYVQSITFGRRVLFSIESNDTADSVKGALEATYKEAISAMAKVSPEQKAVLSAATIRAFVIGGSGEEAAGVISGFDGIAKFIKSGGNYSKMSPGAPIAYKLAYLDNTVTRLAFSTEYSERQCARNRGNLRVGLSSIHHIGGTDPIGGNAEFYGFVSLRYPVMMNGVASCASGGGEKDVWRLADGAWITVPNLSTWTPPAPINVDVVDVALGKGQSICLSAHVWEDDPVAEGGFDDDFGAEARLISYDTGWEGDHVLHLNGGGNSAVDVTVSIAIR